MLIIVVNGRANILIPDFLKFFTSLKPETTNSLHISLPNKKKVKTEVCSHQRDHRRSQKCMTKEHDTMTLTSLMM